MILGLLIKCASKLPQALRLAIFSSGPIPAASTSS
jgi:hypothetical protein